MVRYSHPTATHHKLHAGLEQRDPPPHFASLTLVEPAAAPGHQTNHLMRSCTRLPVLVQDPHGLQILQTNRTPHVALRGGPDTVDGLKSTKRKITMCGNKMAEIVSDTYFTYTRLGALAMNARCVIRVHRRTTSLTLDAVDPQTCCKDGHSPRYPDGHL